ncbi:hypothetical protein Hsar01_00432 [Haloferula sargassicola]|uniref:Uncharacterized protein n=1 Tax=Haloferula sargassicola TaxID=490096 RepID=A0ABP9UJ16_9BACT
MGGGGHRPPGRVVAVGPPAEWCRASGSPTRAHQRWGRRASTAGQGCRSGPPGGMAPSKRQPDSCPPAMGAADIDRRAGASQRDPRRNGSEQAAARLTPRWLHFQDLQVAPSTDPLQPPRPAVDARRPAAGRRQPDSPHGGGTSKTSKSLLQLPPSSPPARRSMPAAPLFRTAKSAESRRRPRPTRSGSVAGRPSRSP